MGCSNPRLVREEIAIADDLNETGFEKHSADRVVSAIRRCSVAKFITSDQFSELCNVLELDKTQQQFFDNFKTKEASPLNAIRAVCPRMISDTAIKGSLLDVDQMLVFSIMQSCSSPGDKATALFRVIDEAFTGTATKDAVTQLATMMFDIALDYHPVLLKHKNNEDVKKYLAKGRQNKEKAVAALRVLIMGTETSETTWLVNFRSKLSTSKEGRLTSLSGLREFAAESNAPAKTFVPPPKPTGLPTEKPVLSGASKPGAAGSLKPGEVPKDVVAPPKDVAAPPKDIAAPPKDVAAPPKDVGPKPAEVPKVPKAEGGNQP